ncbi:MAG TPA: hypothetical protein V6D48_10915 [Oculatellaceae cyanobacterium]
MFQNILLESEQKELLILLVETSRKMPRDERRKFIVAQSHSGDTLLVPGHPSQNFKVYMGDIEILAREGLVDIAYGSRGSPNVNVLPLGYGYYEHMKRQAGQPLENVENPVRSYLTSESFRQKYPNAYQKWVEAEDMLWGSDSERQLTTIGHLCREAAQEFATHLVEQYKPINAPEDKALTVARMRAVLNHRKGNMGDKEIACLDALLVYWGTVIDLIQREEHGGQKEGTPLVWEDGRRVVFQLAVVMFEIDGSLAR